MDKRKKGVKTKRKILDAAAKVISQKGYHATTIAEICQLAGANIASINYHFGDKKSLYIETWKNAFQYAIEKYPPDGGVDKNASVEMRIKGWVVSMLRRILDPECFDLEIAHTEMTNSTGFLVEIISSTMEREVFMPLEGLIREALGGKASDEDIELCVMSIQSQCLNPLIFNKRKGRCYPHPMPLNADLEKVAQHVIRFSLGGLERVKLNIACPTPETDWEDGTNTNKYT